MTFSTIRSISGLPQKSFDVETFAPAIEYLFFHVDLSFPFTAPGLEEGSTQGEADLSQGNPFNDTKTFDVESLQSYA